MLTQAALPGLELAHELRKVPHMMEHYQEHHERDGISLWRFLSLHYGIGQETSDHKNDHGHQGDLPFHGEHQCLHNHLVAPLFLKVSVSFKLPEVSIPHVDFYTPPVSTAFLDTLFQPPKA